MKRAEQVGGSILLICSVYIIITALNLGLTYKGHPGAGFMAFWTGVLLAISSVILIFLSFKQEKEESINVFTKKNIKYAGIFLGSSVIAGLLTKWTGMIISMGLLSGFLSVALAEEKDYKKGIAIGVSITVILYLLFIMLLDVQLPRGVLGI